MEFDCVNCFRNSSLLAFDVSLLTVIRDEQPQTCLPSDLKFFLQNSHWVRELFLTNELNINRKPKIKVNCLKVDIALGLDYIH